MARKAHRRWGIVDRQRSGRYRARYTHNGERHAAPITFDGIEDADAWLAEQRTAIRKGTWVHPDEQAKLDEAAAAEAARKATPFGQYATRWVDQRTNSKGEPLRPRTRNEYTRMLTTGYLVDWKDTPLTAITRDAVRTWRAEHLASGAMTQTARAYDLLKSILKTAVTDKLIDENPCQITGGSLTKTGRKVRPPTDDELDGLIEHIEDRYKALVVVAAAGGLRYGECPAPTRGDVPIGKSKKGKVKAVRIAVDDSVVEGAGLARVSGDVKTAAGVRRVAIFGVDAEIVAAHVEKLEPGALLWTDTQGNYVSQSSVNNGWRKARRAVGCEDVTFHALRHYAGTRYAQAGATLAENMARLGHSSAKAAMRYQHAGTRDDELARRAARKRKKSA